jgi:acetylornithine deacetylase/succinyl-diaminopimelate desuccinylase-like protein
MDSEEAGALLVRKLTARPPAGATVTARITRSTPWWTTEPEGPAFDAALRALEKGYGRKPALIGSGASIGFVRPFADAMGVPCLLTGVEDPGCAAHSEDESLHLGDWRKVIRSAVHFYDEAAAVGSVGLRANRTKRR